MGIFNFTKQNVESTPEVKAPEARPETPQPVVNVAPVKPENKKNKPVDYSAGRNNDDISSFFSVDINNIFKYAPEPTGSHEYSKGHLAQVYLLKLSQLELGTFSKVYVIQYEDMHYDLAFRSTISGVKPELQEFMAFCASKYGPDFMSKGEFKEADISDLNLGAFSRLWMNKIRIDNIYMHINLTFYDIKPDRNL
ncbi:MAG: hypothetical protein LBD21_06740 [Tannerellaceae bacterium]|jgi:hypothetical protein|nr:hypothetical protein [Tannerellaceae bacterium]